MKNDTSLWQHEVSIEPPKWGLGCPGIKYRLTNSWTLWLITDWSYTCISQDKEAWNVLNMKRTTYYSILTSKWWKSAANILPVTDISIVCASSWIYYLPYSSFKRLFKNLKISLVSQSLPRILNRGKSPSTLQHSDSILVSLPFQAES